jgi:hypothetical protein
MAAAFVRVLSIFVLSCAAACSSERAAPPPVPPPPLPVAEAPAAAAEPSAAATPHGQADSNQEPSAKAADPSRPKAKKGASLYDIDPSVRPKKTDPVASVEPSKPSPAKDGASEPAQGGTTRPAKDPSTTTDKAEPARAPFVSPTSKHVALDLPAGLKDDLASDKRMKPWLDTAVSHATRCYEREAKSNAGLSGTVEVLIVMHENARPDASLKTLPSQLAGVFTCVSGAMMSIKMPLFTGKEGQRYTARAKFGP